MSRATMARLVTTVTLDDVNLLIGRNAFHHGIGSSCSRLIHFAAVSPRVRKADLRLIAFRLANLALRMHRLSSVIRMDASEGGWLMLGKITIVLATAAALTAGLTANAFAFSGGVSHVMTHPVAHDYGYCHGYASRSSDCYPLW
jgi:hypothetical protein